MKILGIHGGVTLNQHDPAAAIVVDGKVVAAIEEERLIRIKAPRGFLPIKSIQACLKEAGLSIEDIDLVVHPGETYEDMPARIKGYFEHYFGFAPPIQLLNHQMAHLASAFYCSGFKDAMCVSYDAVGDRLSVALARGSAAGIEVVETRGIEDSIGLFYAIMTSYLGFEVSDGEYKVMGLAPYGKEGIDLSPFLSATADDYVLNREFTHRDPPNKSIFEPYYNEKLIQLLGPARIPGSEVSQHYKDIALATQRTLERCAVALVNRLHKIVGSQNLCLAGGVALNCSANYVLSTLPYVKNIYVQPAASDRGLALGCALHGSAQRGVVPEPPKDIYLGPSYSELQVEEALKIVGASYERPADLAEMAAMLLADGNIVGWWQGRSEYGPRALGNRSILADPRPAQMKQAINSRIKFREEFRPFAPAVLAEDASAIFEMKGPSPFMTVAFPVRKDWQEKLKAVTHVNNSARVQTVDIDTNPAFHALISRFKRITGVPVLLNTSFNVKGEPIVEKPLDALATFMSCGMDALCIGPFLVRKPAAPRR